MVHWVKHLHQREIPDQARASDPARKLFLTAKPKSVALAAGQALEQCVVPEYLLNNVTLGGQLSVHPGEALRQP